MQTRHRVPTVFSVYMVDVLCCALGCVIFLWFLKIHEAKIQTRQAERREQAAARTRADLAKTTARLDDVTGRMTRTKARLEEVSRQMAATQERLAGAEKEREQVRRDRNAALARLADLDKEIAVLKTQKSAAVDELTKTKRDKGALAEELAAARQRVSTTEMLLRQKETLARNTARAADDLAERLRSADARVKELRPLAESVPGLRDEARAYRDKLAALEVHARALEKEIGERTTALAGAGKTLQALEDTNLRLKREVAGQTKQLAAAERSMDTLRGEKKTLLAQVGRERAARDNRFAGVALTGRRVVFLVDMSGSMEMVDEQTPAPEKWAGVRQTLTKVMRSLPDLEKFQVIVFSEKVTYLLDDGDAWLDYKGQATLDRVTRALAAVKPEGSTNMSAAFQAAFRFKRAGMDTIYFLSDGLPNVGEGLSEEDSRGMTETQRNETLSQYIRRKLLRVWNPKASDGRPRVRINTIGFFFESPDVGAFLWALARENEGSFVGMNKP